MRFVYCAACICYILDLWQAIDVDLMLQHIISCQTYDSAFGMGVCNEAHGGCTYCAVAALAMMGKLDELPGKLQLIDWCMKRLGYRLFQPQGLQPQLLRKRHPPGSVSWDWARHSLWWYSL